MNRVIPFSPPDITNCEIEAVVDVLKSKWITSGNVNKLFEDELKNYLDIDSIKLLSSATAGLFIALKLYGVGEGDEVIVPSYTYAATANVVIHTGAKVVFIDAVDFRENNFNIDVYKLENAITEKTKAIISVDIAGYPCDYDSIIEVLNRKKNLFKASNNKYQKELNRILFISDAAHSLGAIYRGKKVASQADFTSFSFHAVKNLTTAEGGALAFNSIGNISDDEIYREVSMWALHGQSKSAFDKNSGGKSSWRYDIVYNGFKCNMSDIHAAIGLSQLRRYDDMLLHRKKIVDIYNSILSSNKNIIIPIFKDYIKESSYHLYTIRIKNFTEEMRDTFIDKMYEKGIILNVHYIPLPCMTAYINLGYDIKDYPNSFELYKNEVSLPLYSTLSFDDATYIANTVIDLCS